MAHLNTTLRAIGLLVGLAGAAFGQPGHKAEIPSLHDDRWGRSPVVTAIAISADGQRLAAAYYRHAVNRPGTDWAAWVAVWDLATGKRAILPDACAPIALSPNGKWLAARQYARQENRSFTADPIGKVAIWRFGEAAPATRPARDDDLAHAVVFDAEGSRVMGLAGDGRIWAWPVEGDKPAQEVGRINITDLQIDSQRPDRMPMALERTPHGVMAVVPVQRAESKQSAAYAVAVDLRWEPGNTRKLRQSSVYPFASDPSQAQAQSVVNRLSFGENPTALPLMSDVFAQFARPRSVGWPPAPWVAFGPKGQSIALAGEGQIAVHTMREAELARIPAMAPMRFMPDGKRLVACTRTGVLRIWDIASGAIVRSLRLDDRPAETFRVAAVQCPSLFGDPAANRQTLERLVANAVYDGAEVVVLPETAVTGYMSPDLKRTWQVGGRQITAGLTGVDPKDAAETVPGESTRFFAQVARKWGIYLTVPLLEVDRRTGKFYNTVVLLGPGGEQLIHYRKINPWPWAEKGWATPGDLGRPVVDTPFGRLGTLVCYDIHKQAAEMASLKIDTLLYCIAWVDNRDSDWFPHRLPEIAQDNGFNIVGANWTVPACPDGQDPPAWHGYGQSCIIASDGKVLATAGKDHLTEVIYADLPLPAP